MVATITAYDARGKISHTDTREYPDLALLWEHVGCQANNRSTVRVAVQTQTGVEFEVRFSPWMPERRYPPSSRFQKLLEQWTSEGRGKKHPGHRLGTC